MILGTFSNFHTSLVLILVTLYNFHTNLVMILGPKLWYEAGISLVFKLVTGARLVLPQVPTRLVLVSGWHCLKSFWSGRVLGTILIPLLISSTHLNTRAELVLSSESAPVWAAFCF